MTQKGQEFNSPACLLILKEELLANPHAGEPFLIIKLKVLMHHCNVNLKLKHKIVKLISN